MKLAAPLASALFLGGGAGVALGGASGAQGGETVVVRTTGKNGTSFELVMGPLRRRRDRGPEIRYELTYNPPPTTVTESDGTVSPVTYSWGIGLQFPAAGRRSPAELRYARGEDSCGDEFILGSVARNVRTVVARRVDGSTRRLRRYRPPREWDYHGWLVGAFIGDGPETVRVRAYDSRRKSLGVMRIRGAAKPGCP